MAASSQYHRGAAPLAHYHALPASHEHLYTDLANSWSTSHGALPQAPAPSALLQRFSSPAHLPPAHYNLNYTTGPTDRSNPSLYQHTPSGAYSRSWNPAFISTDTPFASRPLSYSDAGARPSGPHATSQPPRQYEPPSTVALTSSGNDYPPQEQQQHRHEPHVTAASVHLVLPDRRLTPPQAVAVASDAPPFPPDGRTLAPISNYAASDMHVSPSNISPQAAVTWTSQPTPDMSPVAPQHAFGHSDNALASGAVLPSQGPHSSTNWAMVSVAPSSPTQAAYEQLPEAAPLWTVEPDPQPYARGEEILSDAALQMSSLARGKRSLPKKVAAKVPAAFVARSKKSKVSKRKGPLDEQGRRKTHEMRKQKAACVRCRFYKSGCDHGEPCQKCLKVSGGARSFKLGCCRDRLEDAMLVRHCNGRSNQAEGEFLGYEWIPNWELLGMDFIWNLPGTGPVHVQPMRITIGQYRPKRPLLDAATNEWSTTEGRVIVAQPPYAVYDTQSLVPTFESYFTVLQPAVEQWIFTRVSHDEIALLTYQEAMRLRGAQHTGPPNLLDLCLRLQCLSVVSQGYGTVWSNNVPGIQEYDYSKMGRSQYEAYDRNSRDRPLPGAIGQQMDVAALKLLKKLESACHKTVQAKIFKPKIKPWYELYLALYVIFWNMEYIHHSATSYIVSKNGTTVENHVNNVVNNQLKKWEYSFEVLLYYWKTCLRDYLPFKVARDNPEELRSRGHLDAQGFEYITKVASVMDRIGAIGQSTAPYTGFRSTHNSLSSIWIKTLLESMGA